MIIIGIDVGTMGTKALAVDETGKILGRGYREYPIETPKPGWVTQNAGVVYTRGDDGRRGIRVI